jgi:hypothetical protein
MKELNELNEWLVIFEGTYLFDEIAFQKFNFRECFGLDEILDIVEDLFKQLGQGLNVSLEVDLQPGLHDGLPGEN